jgi:hypothetical protein
MLDQRLVTFIAKPLGRVLGETLSNEIFALLRNDVDRTFLLWEYYLILFDFPDKIFRIFVSKR